MWRDVRLRLYHVIERTVMPVPMVPSTLQHALCARRCLQELQGEVTRYANDITQLSELAKAQFEEITRLKEMQHRLAKSKVRQAGRRAGPLTEWRIRCCITVIAAICVVALHTMHRESFQQVWRHSS